MQRIKRNAAYFTDRTKQNHWCEPCFNLLDSEKLIPLDDGSEVMKRDLQEFKNDALPEEGWVNCDTCQSWVHQVCALFNGRTNKSTARFTCPTCYLNIPTSEESRENARKIVKGADDLPRCKMSDVLERGLHDALRVAYQIRSTELGVAVEDVEKAEGLCVRVLSNVEKKNVVGEKVRVLC
jgi:E1A/CREB-binding protein